MSKEHEVTIMDDVRIAIGMFIVFPLFIILACGVGLAFIWFFGTAIQNMK